MELKDMKTATPEALQKALREAEARLRTLRTQLSANQLKNVREVRKVRQTIARLKTTLAAKANA
jgi:ribosomal protein L29